MIAQTDCVCSRNARVLGGCFRGRGTLAFSVKLDCVTSGQGAAERQTSRGKLIVFNRFPVLGAMRAERASFAVDLMTLATYRSHHCERGHSEAASLPEQACWSNWLARTDEGVLAVCALQLRVFFFESRSILYCPQGGTCLVENGLTGPFALTDRVIDEEVCLMSAGAFVLDSENGAEFHAVFVGRSDLDVNSQLHLYVGVYKRFKFVYCSSAKAAFERECGLFHDFDPYDNAIHPLRQAGPDWTCPRCKLLG